MCNYNFYFLSNTLELIKSFNISIFLTLLDEKQPTSHNLSRKWTEAGFALEWALIWGAQMYASPFPKSGNEHCLEN